MASPFVEESERFIDCCDLNKKNYEVEKDGYEKGNIFDEVKMTESGSQFVPVPGTLQYGNPIKVVNKEDFE